MTKGKEIAVINNLMDNWDKIKNIYTPGYFSNNSGSYKFQICWFNADCPLLGDHRIAFPNFTSYPNGDRETNRNIDFVIRAGYWESELNNKPVHEFSINFVELRRHTTVISIKHYEHIDISKFDEYAYYSFLSSVIWRLQLANCISSTLTDEHFDYCHDKYLYVFLTGEEADYDKLSEEKKAIVDLKTEEAKDFLKTIHTAIVENLKTMFKENS